MRPLFSSGAMRSPPNRPNDGWGDGYAPFDTWCVSCHHRTAAEAVDCVESGLAGDNRCDEEAIAEPAEEVEGDTGREGVSREVDESHCLSGPTDPNNTRRRVGIEREDIVSLEGAPGVRQSPRGREGDVRLAAGSNVPRRATCELSRGPARPGEQEAAARREHELPVRSRADHVDDCRHVQQGAPTKLRRRSRPGNSEHRDDEQNTAGGANKATSVHDRTIPPSCRAPGKPLSSRLRC